MRESKKPQLPKREDGKIIQILKGNFSTKEKKIKGLPEHVINIPVSIYIEADDVDNVKISVEGIAFEENFKYIVDPMAPFYGFIREKFQADGVEAAKFVESIANSFGLSKTNYKVELTDRMNNDQIELNFGEVYGNYKQSGGKYKKSRKVKKTKKRSHKKRGGSRKKTKKSRKSRKH